VKKRILVRPDRVAFPIIDDLHVINMWEVEGHYQPAAQGAVHQLRAMLEHADEDSLYDYFARHNRYSDWEAQVSLPAGRPLRRIFSHLPAPGLAYFVYSYVFKGGFLDGRAGLDYALAKAFYYWQTGLKRREAKLSNV